MYDDDINERLLKQLQDGHALAYVSARDYVLLGEYDGRNTLVQCALDSHPDTNLRFDDGAHNGLIVKNISQKTLIVTGLNSERLQFEQKLGQYGFPKGKWTYVYD